MKLILWNNKFHFNFPFLKPRLVTSWIFSGVVSAPTGLKKDLFLRLPGPPKGLPGRVVLDADHLRDFESRSGAKWPKSKLAWRLRSWLTSNLTTNTYPTYALVNSGLFWTLFWQINSTGVGNFWVFLKFCMVFFFKI